MKLKSRLILGLTALFTCIAVSAEQLNAKVISQLELQLIENEKRYGSVSQSILVKKKDDVIYRKAHGLSSIELSTKVIENNTYPVYSLAKLFASVTLMKLVEDGKINLDKSITFYLPSLPKSWAHISVRHCLNHTSGIPEYFSMDYMKTSHSSSLKDVIKSVETKPFQFKTGDQNQYNNTNFLVLGAIIETITKRNYVDVVQEQIVNPLALQNTFYAQAKQVIPNLVSSYWGEKGTYTVDKGVNWPTYAFTHSGLYSNKTDLQLFIEGVVKGKIISKETLYAMWQPMKLNSGIDGRYASGWDYTKEGQFVRVGHEGGNRVRLDYHFNPQRREDNYTSIYLTNGSAYKNGITTHLVDGLMSLVSPTDFPTLVLQENILDGVFNKTLEENKHNIIEEIKNSPFIGPSHIENFLKERGYTVYFASYPEAAVTYFRFYTEQNPRDVEGWAYLANSYLATGDKAKAIKHYEKALKIDSSFTYARQKLKNLRSAQ